MASVTDLPLILYPNSGETYDAATKTWHHPVGGPGWQHFVGPWQSLGVKCLGGCCRTLPSDIVEIAPSGRPSLHSDQSTDYFTAAFFSKSSTYCCNIFCEIISVNSARFTSSDGKSCAGRTSAA